MQRVLRINVQARNNLVRTKRQQRLKEIRQEWQGYEERAVMLQRVRRDDIKTERRNRREDWIAGPLAPKRDVGLESGRYGTLSFLYGESPSFPKRLSRDDDEIEEVTVDQDVEPERKDFYGNVNNIVVGDRVCVVRGADGVRGKIGKVKRVNNDTKEVYIHDINKADVRLPGAVPESRQTPFHTMELPIPLQDVRLVFRHTVLDEKTGHVLKDRDVLVQLIRGGGPYLEREHGSSHPEHTRYVSGEGIEIPWPETELNEYETFPVDTRRREVEERTFIPSVLVKPLPSTSVVDELIPKFTSSRRWHEEEFIRTKIMEDLRARWYEKRGLDTPSVELYKARREQTSQTPKIPKKALSRRIQALASQ